MNNLFLKFCKHTLLYKLTVSISAKQSTLTHTHTHIYIYTEI